MFTLFKCLFCSEQVSTTVGLGYSLRVGDPQKSLLVDKNYVAMDPRWSLVEHLLLGEYTPPPPLLPGVWSFLFYWNCHAETICIFAISIGSNVGIFLCN